MPVRRIVLLTLTALAAFAPVAGAHVTGGGVSPFTAAAELPPANQLGVAPTQFEAGPCTDYAAGTMPIDEGHDHLAPAQHQFACRGRQTAFLPLVEELTGRRDVVLGEMDIKGDLAVVAAAYPESGFLLFDVSDPSQPRFLSWYRGDECESLLIDVDCGAFVDLSPDGKRVYLSVQQISVVPGSTSTPPRPTPAYPGIDVIDISTPTAPKLAQKYPVVSVGGVHTTRSFTAADGKEYTVSVANGIGAHIAEVRNGLLVPVTTIEMDELHDTFIQKDPLTGKTLLYVAAGLDTGFYVYDVSNPAKPEGLAEWDLTPQCARDWYSHTIDVTTVKGRRIVTMPAELFDFGAQSAADQGQGCGKVYGNGDQAGPLWIVDATDFSKLGTLDAEDTEAQEEASDMQAKSASALIATWTNAAERAGGTLVFSPHNQQIVGDRIYLSGYHSGVTVLDASKAFRGEHVRPAELGVYVPHGEGRPIADVATGSALVSPFFTEFLPYRPNIWDMQWHKGYVIAADMVGGVYSLRFEADERGAKRRPAR